MHSPWEHTGISLYSICSFKENLVPNIVEETFAKDEIKRAAVEKDNFAAL